MLIDIHSHHIHTAEGILAPRSFGIHPWLSDLFTYSDLPDLRRALEATCGQDGVALVGECGMDALRGADKALQQALFEMHAEVAEAVAKPVVVHCVRCFGELMSMRKARRYSMPWIVHGYMGSPQMALQLWQLGIWCSFGAAIIDSKHHKPIEALRQLGAERLFLETDASAVAIDSVYAAAAEHLMLSVDMLACTINESLSRLLSDDKKLLGTQ